MKRATSSRPVNVRCHGTVKDRTTIYDDTALYNSGLLREFDTNGDGNIDRSVEIYVDQDGFRWEFTDFWNADGSLKTEFEQDTTPDGGAIYSGLSSNPGPTETTYFIENSNGSYLWQQLTDTRWQTATHTIDLAGVDHWDWGDQAPTSAAMTIRTIVIDLESEKRAIETARRLYDTAFDRTMQQSEIQLLAAYITNGVVDTTKLANDLMATTEFTTKYGTLTNLQFIERVYQNALGRAPSLAELNTLVSQLTANTITRAGVMNLVSEKEEHLVIGDDHFVTNNTNSGNPTAFDHTTDKQIAGDMVRRLYDTALDRSADAAGLAANSAALLNGTQTEFQVAATLITSAEFTSKYGTLSNTAFVAQMFQNAIGRAPTAAESLAWTSALTAGTVSRADLVVGIAESSEHLVIMGAGFSIGGAGNDIIFAPNTADTIDGGAGINTLDYSLLSNPGVNVDLTAGTAAKPNAVTDHLTNIQNVVGTSGVDTLSGNSAANALTGGGGADAFLFKAAFGADTVTDFQAIGSAHDLLQFDAAAFSSASAALAAAHQVGADVVINSGTNSVTLKGMNLASLTTADFRIQ